MIKSFACKDTEKIWNGEITRRWSLELQNRALVKLRLVDAVETFDDLKIPPGNRSEYLNGDRLGQISVRINDQWRLCFSMKNGEVSAIEIVDYHR